MTAQEIIEQTKKLMTIQSTADRPADLKRAVKFVEDIVSKNQGVTIERFGRNGRPSFLAYRKGSRPEKFDILLNGHVDVVPGKPGLFKPYEKDGRLYGRGALDMKGTALTLTDVFCELVNEVPYSLGLQIVSDEEIGGYDGVKMHIDQGVRADFVIMGEYANDKNAIYNAARGLCWTEIEFRGKSAHGGHLWHGSNAVVKAGAFAGAVLKRYPVPDKETWTTTASVSSLSTPNQTYNKVPDRAVLKIDFRFTQEDPVFRNKESLEAFIHELDPDARLVKTATFEPAVHVEELNPYVQGMSRAVQKVTKQKPKYLGRPAASDGRHYSLVNNDIVEFGIYGQGSHSNREYAELSSFAEYRQMLREFLRNPIPARLKTDGQDSTPIREKLLRKLVEMPTLSDDFAANNRAFGFVGEFLRERGMYVETIDINGYRSMVATTKKGNKTPKVLLNAHMDVVPGTPEMFKLKLLDGKFVGRGVMDMKHAVAAYMSVVDSLSAELDGYDFGIMITSDEEVGSNHGAKPLVEMGYRPKVVVIPDGGNNWKLETFAKGVKWAKLEAKGKSAHASRPWEGESAITRLLDAIREIQKHMPTDPTPKDTLMSVGTINGGIAANQIPDTASAMLDIRTGSVEDHERLTPLIEKICDKHGLSITFQSDEPPCVTDPEHPLIKPMVDIVSQVTGQVHETSYDFAVTDGRIFSAAGIPAIIINPDCGNIHREDEWLSQSSFEQFCDVIKKYVCQMAVPEPQDLAREEEIALLAKRLDKPSKPIFVWYATYGSGLHENNFLQYIKGGKTEGAKRAFNGCRDASSPLENVFTSLPYKLYFSGESLVWGGGFARIEPVQNPEAHTISRLYLIKLEQFEDIYEQINTRGRLPKLALKTALKYGHTTIGDGTKDYDSLLFCGMRDGHPILTLTSSQIRTPFTTPSAAYTRTLCKGLSESVHGDINQSLDYLLSAPGIDHSHSLKDLGQSFRKPMAKSPAQE